MKSEPPQRLEDAQLITIQDVAAMLRLSVRSVRRLVSKGELVPPIKIGRAARWRKHEILVWIQDGCAPPPKKPR